MRLVDLYGKVTAFPYAIQRIVLGMWVLMLVFVVYLILFPMSSRIVQKRRDLIGLDRQIQQVNTQILNLAGQPDLQKMEKMQLAAIREQIRLMKEQLQSARQDLVPASKMPALLEGLVRADPQVRLVSLKTLPTVVLDTGPTPVLEGDPIYQHAVEITVEGNFFDLVDYAQQIEQLPWQMYWSGLKLEVVKWPKEKMTITLDTLGLEKAWLSIPSHH
ncbi:MAG TPA: type 4a pilus biogenesis protein PilO [Burkholderiales bacterium]|nr:type 4a pilus biogenesis protein PilO [Burkholderiales bacterium]